MDSEELVEMIKRTLVLMSEDDLNVMGMLIASESLRRLEARRMDEMFGTTTDS